ncbi:hypothetical protein [Gracilimonas halophila]|uniref:Uncharacterized protein n=1 Tax=Gracilimonas halophila TaxID=1834464 RepID=A0ABW5JKT2_9BACT
MSGGQSAESLDPPDPRFTKDAAYYNLRGHGNLSHPPPDFAFAQSGTSLKGGLSLEGF